jgi:hypothetical protein
VDTSYSGFGRNIIHIFNAIIGFCGSWTYTLDNVSVLTCMSAFVAFIGEVCWIDMTEDTSQTLRQ